MPSGHLPFRVPAIAVSDGGCNGGLIDAIDVFTVNSTLDPKAEHILR
jgi:hypothetical protein